MARCKMAAYKGVRLTLPDQEGQTYSREPVQLLSTKNDISKLSDERSVNRVHMNDRL